MEKIQCVIVDDELSILKTLKRFIQQIPQLELAATFTDSVEALEFIRKSDEYLIFLDISMDTLSGLDLAKLIPNKVVFITGHAEFALESWKLDNVLGYLTKPVFFEDIVGVLKRLSNFWHSDYYNIQVNSDKYFSYKHDDVVSKIELDNIIYIEANNNYTTFYLEGNVKIVPVAIWDIEKSLPKSKFIRISKSVIANTNKIIDDSKEVILLGGFSIKPGKAYKVKSKKSGLTS
ncbi:LytR/AlgR family response regulator transcription factor [Sphingobacterium detergens]|uniref:LytTR family two component transcriptional regulator n=1 Tax=Sphingobacterium detergens TaxID=1145106 RepID=A0A420ARN1_SPHD1|nr:LytTR family DNA-binding domain-containing protein [Sphingobacterium detergens]RKE47134.1 LytTR family two component transcriptional regulator [Sphingobacterium detergens]